MLVASRNYGEKNIMKEKGWEDLFQHIVDSQES